MTIQIRCLLGQSDLLGLQDDWESLTQRCPAASVFQTYVWQTAWWKHYGTGSPYLLLAYSNGDLVAILPLYRTEQQLPLARPLRRIRPIGVGGDTSPDYLGQIALGDHANDSATAFVGYLFDHKTDWDLLELTDLPELDPLLERLRRTRATSDYRIMLSVPTRISWAALPNSWDAYLGGLSSNARHTVRSTRRRFLALPRSRIFQWNDEAQLDFAISQLILLHTQRWQNRSAHFSFSSATYNAFHNELMHEFAKRDWLRLYCMELDGKLIGVFYGYAFRNTLYYFQGGFDPQHEKLRVGLCLMAFAIESAIAEGCNCLDMLRGEYEYKRRWAVSVRQTFSCTVIRSTWSSCVHRILSRFILPAGVRGGRLLRRVTGTLTR